MPDSTILCGKRGLPSEVTVGMYKAWELLPDKGWSKKPDFLKQRLRERYIDPIERLKPEDKNGFNIMAVSCLMIETLESFYQGLGDTRGESGKCFKLFFARQPRFKVIQGAGLAASFYSDVRCGILHQGEARGGWTISRSGAMFDRASMRLNATAFHRQLALALSDYCNELATPPAGGLHPKSSSVPPLIVSVCLFFHCQQPNLWDAFPVVLLQENLMQNLRGFHFCVSCNVFGASYTSP